MYLKWHYHCNCGRICHPSCAYKASRKEYTFLNMKHRYALPRDVNDNETILLSYEDEIAATFYDQSTRRNSPSMCLSCCLYTHSNRRRVRLSVGWCQVLNEAVYADGPPSNTRW